MHEHNGKSKDQRTLSTNFDLAWDMNNPRRYRYLVSYLRRIREAIERVPDTICNCGGGFPAKAEDRRESDTPLGGAPTLGKLGVPIED